MKALIFGILGGIAAALYWKFAVYTHPAMSPADWISVTGYTAFGIVVGWVIGFAISKYGSDSW